MIKKVLLVLIIPSLLYAQGSGTPSNLRVRTDANNYLLVVAAAQTLPLSNPTVFTNTRLKTDSSGSLQVVLTGSVTPTYPLAIPASTCAAPSLGESGAVTTGIAFTATPSILNCISGTAVTTLTGSAFTSTVNFFSPQIAGGTTNTIPTGVSGYFVSTSNSDPRGLMTAQFSDDTIAARLHFRKSRGTETVPTTIVSGDVLGRVRYSGYDGSNYLQMASIDAVSTGTIGTNRVPTYLSLSTATNAATSVLTEGLRLTQAQITNIITLGLGSVSSPTAFILSNSANNIDILNSTNPQKLNIYNTFTNATTYERLSAYWSSNIAIIETNSNGGAARALVLGTVGNATTNIQINNANRWTFSVSADSYSLFPNGDNASDLGLTTNRIRTGYFSTSVVNINTTNGQRITDLQTLTELTTIAASPTTDTTIQMPANSVVLGVAVRVTTVIPTATNFTVGDSGSAARFSTAAVSSAANSTDPGTKAGAYYNATALSIRITPDMTPANNTGRVRVVIYYYTVTPPTS